MKRVLYLIVSLILLLFSCTTVWSQGKFALKTNVLYGSAALFPNIGAELGINKNSTIKLWGGFNEWDRDGSKKNNKKLAHWIVQPEYRYWFCERFSGHFIGGHAFYSKYNISNHKLPILFGGKSKDHRYDGNIVGVGVSYGYHVMLNKLLNLEFTGGVGYGRMKYDKYECYQCGKVVDKSAKRNYFGPTSLGVSLVFMIK